MPRHTHADQFSKNVLREALEDLSALPHDAWEHSVVTPHLAHWGLVLSKEASEEDDMSAEIRAWFEEYERNRRAENRAEQAGRCLLIVLRTRGFVMPDATRERILAQKDAEQIERWLEKAAVAASLGEILDGPS